MPSDGMVKKFHRKILHFYLHTHSRVAWKSRTARKLSNRRLQFTAKVLEINLKTLQILNHLI